MPRPSGRRALGRRSPGRPVATALRQRGAATALPAGDRPRRDVLQHRDERTGLGLGSRLGAHESRTRRRGWLLNGAKIWTSGAHHAHAFFVLARSAAVEGDRWAGLSQFIVPLEAAGIGIRPIRLRGCGRGATSTAARPTGRSGWAHAPASSARRDRGRRSPRHDAVHTRWPAHHRDPRRPGSPRRSPGLVRRARGVER